MNVGIIGRTPFFAGVSNILLRKRVKFHTNLLLYGECLVFFDYISDYCTVSKPSLHSTHTVDTDASIHGFEQTNQSGFHTEGDRGNVRYPP